MPYVTLHEGWTVRPADGTAPPHFTSGPLPAVVPGVVHTDLLRAGAIADPFDGANESDQHWIGRTDWQFETFFEWEPDGSERYDLVAHGLDTVASIELNGHQIGETRNQHRSYRFDIRSNLTVGRNFLSVTFKAPVSEAERLAAVHGALPHTNHHPYNMLRKAASNFGWDWGIDVATSGIWKPIGIESWSGTRISAVRPLVSLEGQDGILTTMIDLEWASASNRADRVSVTVAGCTVQADVPQGQKSVRILSRVENVNRWWPRGHGDQPLYDVAVSTSSNPAVWNGRVGFRTIAVDTAPDEAGSPFIVRVNGETILIRGANWIPDHAFITEVDRDRYRRRVRDATEANINLLRVWGGGIYESKDFYDACDEAGVLVWQDFLFACAAYAEEEWLAVEIEAEASEAITRLAPHPSLAIWNGNNENIWGYVDWNWRTGLAGRTWGNGYYRDMLPRLVNELDGTRPYSPGSPFSYDDYIHPNDQHHGTMHIWDVWNQRDYSAYAEYRPRFVSEFGFQGPPAWTTLTAVVHDEPLEPYGAQMLVHQKAADGNLKLENGMKGHLPVPDSVEEWHWAGQLNQAHALRFGIEHYRALTPHNTGVIVWQLNDNWPVVSWSAVDFAERRKPLWYAMKEAYSPRLATIQTRGGSTFLVLLNDTRDPFDGDFTLRRMSFDGRVLKEQTIRAAIPPRGQLDLSLPADLTAPNDPSTEVLVAEPCTNSGFNRAFRNYAEPVNQILDADALEMEVEPSEDGFDVIVTATSYVRDVFLQADRVDPCARVDAGLISLLPGDSFTFHVRGATSANTEDFKAPFVLCSVNSLVAGIVKNEATQRRALGRSR